MAGRSETETIELLRSALARDTPGVVVAIGDDAAVLEPHDAPLVWTTDAQVEGVHFRRDWLSFAELGYRATMAAVSDLAAMGARPRGVLSSLILPADVTDADVAALAAGQAEACDEVGTSVVGGNLARGSELSLTTGVLGEGAHPLRRAGAQIGDGVFLAGPVGLAAAAVALLERAVPTAPSAAEAAALRAYRRPTARITAGLRAASLASAAIDVSDGLASDLAQLVSAARGGGELLQIELEPARLVGPDLAKVADGLAAKALDLALQGGDDYALCITAATAEPPQGFVPIGTCRRASPGSPSVLLRHADGQLEPVESHGYDHFR